MWRNDKMIWSQNLRETTDSTDWDKDTNLCFCLFWRSVAWSSNAINAALKGQSSLPLSEERHSLAWRSAAPRVQWLLTCALTYLPPRAQSLNPEGTGRGQTADTTTAASLFSSWAGSSLPLSEIWGVGQYCQKEKEMCNNVLYTQCLLIYRSDKCIVQPN